MIPYFAITEERNMKSPLSFYEPEALYLTGSENKTAILPRKNDVQTKYRFLTCISAPIIPFESLGNPNISPFYSSVIINLYSDIDFLSNTYNFINSNEIKQFLFTHSEIIPQLIESLIEISIRFYIVTPKIELITDVELPDWKTLFITIPHNLEYEDAFERLNDLLQNWAFYQPKSFKQLVTIAIE